jgi:hypothetical protein
MKNYFLLFALSAITFLSSCNKEKDSDSGPAKNSHRISQFIIDGQGYDSDEKEIFNYEGERLSEILEYTKDDFGDWILKYKNVITYDGENATTTWYYKESGDWIEEDKSDYLIENGLMMEETYFNLEEGEWVESWKWAYQYSGTDIIGWQVYDYDDQNSSAELDGKGEYIYENNKLVQFQSFYKNDSNNWENDDKQIFNYAGSNLAGWTDYDWDFSENNWIEYFKCEHTYTGNLVQESNYYDWNSVSDDWESSYSRTYEYNDNGYLIEEVSDNDEDGYKATFEYEEGNGNAKFFFYYPEELVYGGATIKSASIKKQYLPYFKRMDHKQNM